MHICEWNHFQPCCHLLTDSDDCVAASALLALLPLFLAFGVCFWISPEEMTSSVDAESGDKQGFPFDFRWDFFNFAAFVKKKKEKKETIFEF